VSLAFSMSLIFLLAASELPGAEGYRPSCEHIQAQVERLLQAGPAIDLSAEPKAAAGALGAGEGMDCEGIGPLKRALQAGKPPEGSGVVLGKLGGLRAAASSRGPSGSGRFWEVSIAVQTPEGIVGGCTSASTVAWRNIYDHAGLFGRWEPLARGADGESRLIVWWSVEGREQASNASYVLVPLAYRLEGRRLVVDVPATRLGLARFGDCYAAVAATPGDRFVELHRAAAEALRASAARAACGGDLPTRPVKR